MLKLVISSDLNIPFFPSIHNIGMNKDTVESLATLLERILFMGSIFSS